MAIQPKKSIGILGGMGPAASADFLERVVTLAQHSYGADQDTDYPVTYLYSMPLTHFDETGITDVEAVREQLESGVKKVASFGSDVIVIPCNTVHLLIPEMRAAAGVPIISIIETSAEAARAAGHHTVGLLTSATTRKYKLYEAELAQRDIKYIGVTDEEQIVLNTAIHHVMTGAVSKDDAAALGRIISRMASEGATAIVLGCTELPLAITEADSMLPLISSTGELAKAALVAAYGN